MRQVSQEVVPAFRGTGTTAPRRPPIGAIHHSRRARATLGPQEGDMRMLLRVTIPHETFNAAVRDGSAGRKLDRILQEIKPEAVYFTEFGGRRSSIIIVDLPDASRIPALAEPWFLAFNADVEFHPAMTPDDLAKAGLDALGKKWA
jgi:hypothetical protein